MLPDGRPRDSRVITLLGGRLGLRPAEIQRVAWDTLVTASCASGAETEATAAEFRAIPLDRSRSRSCAAGSLSRAVAARTHRRPHDRRRAQAVGHQAPAPARREVTVGRIAKASTYPLRHSHASALHYAGFTVPEAAGRMGHTQQTHVLHYAHVLAMGRTERYAGLDELYAASALKGSRRSGGQALGEQ